MPIEFKYFMVNKEKNNDDKNNDDKNNDDNDDDNDDKKRNKYILQLITLYYRSLYFIRHNKKFNKLFLLFGNILLCFMMYKSSVRLYKDIPINLIPRHYIANKMP